MGYAVPIARHRRTVIYACLAVIIVSLLVAFSQQRWALMDMFDTTPGTMRPSLGVTGPQKHRVIVTSKGRTVSLSPIQAIQPEPTQTTHCPDILGHMTQGRWRTSVLTRKESNAILVFLTHPEARYRFPPEYQRRDAKCGNVSHDNPKYEPLIRALCNPLGQTPCCYNNHCEERPVHECFCPNCIDIRRERHAEFSTWVPSDTRCKYKTYSAKEACRVLTGTVLHFVGDSFVRHLHTAMLLLLSGNVQTGALNAGVPTDILGKCSGWYMFTEKTCRHHLNYNYVGCGGSVRVVMKYYYNSGTGRRLKEETLRELKTPRTMLVMGIATHDAHSSKRVKGGFLSPVLNAMKNMSLTWPKLLWVDQHAPGLTKTPWDLEKSREKAKTFNSEMEPYLREWSVPILKTYNLTDGMCSFDSEHYGRGINMAKANLLLNYIEEIQRKGEWS
ncbi:uncharacterized protein LOC124122432 [Haliotis rufescens]|uniref:uncharacterized protein LOC124122432 n=1 Tax=Haliotis rufescens TaxID=6454 RepID=UPI00201EF746|nr:uncharacterized protein LOC124122432 [Haliotis rufescens]